MQYTYDYNGQSYTLHLDRQPDGTYQARIGEQTLVFTATPAGAGKWLLSANGRQLEVNALASGDMRYVQVAGQQYTLTTADSSTKRRRSRGAGGGELTAQMPGQVREVRVQAGDAVKVGDTLVVLEAMKMEIRVTAPADGTVKQVYVQAGAVVERGQRLVEVG
jgi:biotin carboxyl carrier protein